MKLVHYKELRRIRQGEFKDVYLIKPADRDDYELWRHCTGSKQIPIPYKSYIARKISLMLFMHGVRRIEICQPK